MVGNSVDDFGVNDDGIESDQVGDEFADLNRLVENRKSSLLIKRDAA